jgi:flagellar biosynthesis/type III secretory pathway M-ring protein FliF/YscJ
VLVPELSDGPHFWYAVQWFMFTGIGVLGVVVFIRGDLRARRENATAVASGAQQEAASAGGAKREPASAGGAKKEPASAGGARKQPSLR